MDDWLIEKLEQMRNAAVQACDFIETMTKAEFLADKRTQQACAMNLIILGESARRVCERYPELTTQELTIEWRLMNAMRNYIAHEYEKINFSVVWETIRDDLPEQIAQIDALLSQ